MVSIITFQSDKPNSNPAVFSVIFVFENNEIKQNNPGLAHSKNGHG